MDVQKTALSLLSQFGKKGALDHVDYVLSPQFELQNADLRQFWKEVQEEIQRRINAEHYSIMKKNLRR